MLNEGKLLPPAWHHKDLVSWKDCCSAQDGWWHASKVQRWVETFWNFVAEEQEREKKSGRTDLWPTFMAGYGEWPLIPIRNGNLLAVKHCEMLFTEETFEKGSIEESLITLLQQKLGCLLFLDHEHFPHLQIPSGLSEKTRRFNGKNLIAVLHQMLIPGKAGVHAGTDARTQFSLLTDHERQLILRYVAMSSDGLDQSDVDRLRSIPIFPLVNVLVDEKSDQITVFEMVQSADSNLQVNNRETCSPDSFTSLEKGKWYTLPADYTHFSQSIGKFLHGMSFLKSIKLLEPLYHRLGILPLSRTSLYLDFIFPRIVERTKTDGNSFFEEKELENEIQCHLTDIRMNFERLIEESSHFEERILGLPLLKGPDGKRHEVRKFLDPTVHLLYYFRHEWMLPTPYSQGTTEWLPFFHRLGLIHKVDAKLFLEFAREVSHLVKDDPTKAKKKSVILIQYLNDHFNEICTSSDATPGGSKTSKLDVQFCEELREIEFVPCIDVQQRTAYQKKMLYKFSEIGEFWDFDLIWSQLPILDEQLTPNYYLKRKLKMHSITTDVDVVIAHLLFMIQLFDGQRLCLASNQLNEKRQAEKILHSFREIYSFLDKCCGENEKLKLLIVDRLGHNRPWIYHLVPCDEPTTAATVSLSAGKKRDQMLKYNTTVRLQFLAPSRLFYEVEQEIPHLLYRVPNWLSHGFAFLLDAFQISEVPTVQFALELLQQIIDTKRSESLTDTSVSQFSMLIEIVYAQLKKSGDTPAINHNFCLPDEKGCLRPCNEVFLFDTPWLKGRIRLTQGKELIWSRQIAITSTCLIITNSFTGNSEVMIPILHPSISKEAGTCSTPIVT